VLCAAVAVTATELDMEDEAPVPEGFSLPNIFNPVLDRADGRDQAKTLVGLVAKEPKVAYGVGGPEAKLEDMWNGEKDPESSASVAQQKMLREVDQLTKLIDQGKKILKVLPRKQKRLALLKRKLSKSRDAKAKRIANEKLEEQQALLGAIKKREGKMSKRLRALKKSQKRLNSSVKKLRRVISGKRKGKKSRKARKGKKRGRKSRKGRKGRKSRKGKAKKSRKGKAKKSRKGKKARKGKGKNRKGKKSRKGKKKKSKKAKKPKQDEEAALIEEAQGDMALLQDAAEAESDADAIVDQ